VKDLNPPFGAEDKHSEFFARKNTKNTGKRTSGNQGIRKEDIREAGGRDEGRRTRDERRRTTEGQKCISAQEQVRGLNSIALLRPSTSSGHTGGGNFRLVLLENCLGESVTTKSQGPYLEYGYLSRNPSVMEGVTLLNCLDFCTFRLDFSRDI
jgi:hypothetical protein